MRRGLLSIVTPVIAITGAGCAVGPDFREPPPPSGSSYTHESIPAETAATAVAGGQGQHLQWGQELPAQWWKLFGSSDLERLVGESIKNYPDIAAQQAALQASREDAAAQRGILFPQISANAAAQREKSSGAALGPGFPGFISNVYQGSVNVSYSLDVFGGQRRALEGLHAQEENQRFKLEASYLTLTSNLVATAVQVASLTDQIEATREIVAIQGKQLDFIRRRFDAGALTRADVLQQESSLAQVRATLPTLEQQRNVAEHSLAVLVGHLPADFEPLSLSLSKLTLPRDLPVSLPGALVAQRPDIRAQAALLKAANAQVGVATANLLPQITLTGAIGRESLDSSTLFTPNSAFWNIAAGVTQPLFEGGALRARRRAVVDRYEQAGAQYRLTVLQAFQNVADTLTALEQDAISLQAQSDALAAARSSLELIQRQYDEGALNYASLLSAQQLYSEARLAQVRAVASRYLDTVSLFQALGGGWWNRPESASSGS